MIALSVLTAGLAVALFVRPTRSKVLRRRLIPAPTVPPTHRPRKSIRQVIIIAVIMIGPPVVLGLTIGPQGAWLAIPVMIIIGTCGLIWWRSLLRRRSGERRQEVAQACSVLAGQVRIGQPPVTALRSAAEDCDILRAAVATADLGGDVVSCWRQQASIRGQSGLDDLACAWQLSAVTGSGMAEALDDVAEGLAADESLSLVINSEAAGPRASGKVMAALPLIGVGLGYLIGGDPVAFLINTPAGWGCLTAGAALVAIGVLWMEQVADRATSWS